MGYDSTNGKLVLYGGSVSSTYYPETWTTSDPSDGWELVATDTFVSARKGSAMAWDATNNGLLMFGGYRADNVRLNDMWLWDGADWNAIDSVDKPTPRYNHSMVTDPATGDIYLFGGRDASNVDLNDLWIWEGTLIEVKFQIPLSRSLISNWKTRPEAKVQLSSFKNQVS